MLKSVILLCLFLEFTISVKLPSNFQKCNRNQPDLKDCVLKAAQDGINQLTKPFPEVNIPSLNPFEIPEVVVGTGTKVVNVEQKFRNCQLYGLNQIKFKKYEFDFDKQTVLAEGTFPEIKILGDYDLDGKILFVPLKGRGPGSVNMKNVEFYALFNYETKKKKNKTFMKFMSANITMNPGLVSYQLTSLFDEKVDKRFGENINQVLNDNWKEVFDDVKEGYIEIINKVLISLYNGFFGKVSIEELFD